MSLVKATKNGGEVPMDSNSTSNGHSSHSLNLLNSSIPIRHLNASTHTAVHSEQYTEALAQSTTMFNGLLKTMIKVIDLRLHVSRKTSNNIQELEDALFLTKIDPHNYNAFLLAAKLYSIQGKQEAASELLGEAIDACLDSEHRTLLEQQLAVVQARMNRRIDFITQLPYEIFCDVLSHFDTATAIECLYVCRFWRNKVRQCSIPWRTINISTKSSLSIVVKVLPAMASHVQELHVAVKFKYINAWIEFFKVHGFGQLRSLRLKTKGESSGVSKSSANASLNTNEIESDNRTTTSAPLYAVFSYVAQTLTDLRIHLTWHTDFSLARLLSCCQNLTVLHCSAYQIKESFDEIPLTYTTSLVSVYLETSSKTAFNASKLEPLFQCSPRLRHISLNSIRDDILPLIETHCPMIQAIDVSPPFYDDFIDDECERITTDIISGRCSSPGLQFLLVSKVRSLQPLRMQLECSQTSLKYMHLQPMNSVDSGVTDWQPFVVLYGLKYLSLDLGGGSLLFRTHIPNLLCHCPNLEILLLDVWYQSELQIDVVPSPILDRLYDAIAGIKKLQQLTLGLFDLRSSHFLRLLQFYSIQGEHGILRDLRISFCHGITDTVLYRIGKIKSLESVAIHFGNNPTIQQDITPFVDLLTQLPKLSVLELGDIELSFDNAQRLSESRTLQSLTIANVPMSAETMKLLVQRFEVLPLT